MAGGLGGVVLGLIGYVPNVEETVEVVTNIKRATALLPALLYFDIFLILVFWYPLSKKKLEEISKELVIKREAK